MRRSTERRRRLVRLGAHVALRGSSAGPADARLGAHGPLLAPAWRRVVLEFAGTLDHFLLLLSKPLDVRQLRVLGARRCVWRAAARLGGLLRARARAAEHHRGADWCRRSAPRARRTPPRAAALPRCLGLTQRDRAHAARPSERRRVSPASGLRKPKAEAHRRVRSRSRAARALAAVSTHLQLSRLRVHGVCASLPAGCRP